MKRRDFLLGAAAAGIGLGAGLGASRPARARPVNGTAAGGSPLLVLIELQGGNDGWNTVIPYGDDSYRRLRPTLAVPRARVVQLDQRRGLHPALAGLLPTWHGGELALIEGVGCPSGNLSHFRAQQIRATASDGDAYCDEGWVARALTQGGVRGGALLVGGEAGPLYAATASTPADALTLDASTDVRRSGQTDFAASVAAALRATTGTAPVPRAATRAPAARPASPVAVVKLTLPGFDTHRAQAPIHARLLGELAGGLLALRAGLLAAGRWRDTLVMTYAEFGRHPAQNRDAGTEHGRVSTQLLLGGRVNGGFHGAAASLRELGGDRDAIPTVDFRSVYASVLRQWWHQDPQAILGRRFDTLALLRG